MKVVRWGSSFYLVVRVSAEPQERMMSQIETVVEIQRPIEQVFAYLTDLRNMTEWVQGIVEAERMPRTELGWARSTILLGCWPDAA